MMLLKDKVCLITGGGSGIGKATAERFVSEGATVCIAGIDEPSLQTTASELGENCTWRRCDVRDNEQVAKLICDMPKVDVVVACAAISVVVDPLKDSLDQWQQLIDVNMWGVVFTCREAGRKMIEQKSDGRIVIVSSLLGTIAEAGSTPYAIAKGALNQLARQLAVEWAGQRILVNAVAPGCVQTPMSFATGTNEYESEWFRRFFVNPERPRIPLERPGRPEEIAEAILFLANPRNSYCTGSVVMIDGGLGIKY